MISIEHFSDNLSQQWSAEYKFVKRVNLFNSAKDQLVPIFGLFIKWIRELVYLGELS